jgi:CRISPR/Cas system-associated endonuclease Cas1
VSTDESPEFFEEQIAKAQAALREEGRAEERARIVADLKALSEEWNSGSVRGAAARWLADRFEALEHLAKEGT